MMEMVVTTGVQSSSHIITISKPDVLQAGCPSRRSTNSAKAPKENCADDCTQDFQSAPLPLSSYLAEVKCRMV